MLNATYGPARRLDLMQALRRLISYVLTLLMVLALGNDGLILWRQGWSLLNHMFRSARMLFEDSH